MEQPEFSAGALEFGRGNRAEQRRRCPDLLHGGLSYCPASLPGKSGTLQDFFIGAFVAFSSVIIVLYQENENNIIGQYIIFSKVYNQQRKLYGNTKQAVTETIRLCKNRNVLKEYFENKESEVISMMMTLFDDEQILKAYVKETVEETARKNAKETAERLIKKGKMSLEEIADCVPELSLEELKQLESQKKQLT